MSVLKVTKSNKGKDMLCIDGFLFHFERKTMQGTQNWSCAKRKTYKCKSRVVTTLKNGVYSVIKYPNMHDHEPVAVDLAIKESNLKVK